MDPESQTRQNNKVTIILKTCSTPINDDPIRLANTYRLRCPPLSKPHTGQFIHLKWVDNDRVWFEVRVVKYHESTNEFDVLHPCHTRTYIETVNLDQRS